MKPINLALPHSQALSVSQAISHIYHFTQGETNTRFGEHALTQLAGLIDIDSACWLVLTGDQPINVAAQFGYRLPDDFESGFCPLITTGQLQKLQLRSGNCIIWQPANDNYHSYLQGHDIGQQILSLVQHGNTRHLIVLNRRTTAFSQTQRQLVHFVVQAMSGAFHQSLQAKLARHRCNWHSHKAICDGKGHLIEAQTGFITILQQNLASWDHQHLPQQFSHDSIKLEVVENDGLKMAEVYIYDRQIESLSPAERRVAGLLLTGKTNKDIAQILGRSDKTIELQMKSLCDKLDAPNRIEAIMILKHSDYRFI